MLHIFVERATAAASDAPAANASKQATKNANELQISSDNKRRGNIMLPVKTLFIYTIWADTQTECYNQLHFIGGVERGTRSAKISLVRQLFMLVEQFFTK